MKILIVILFLIFTILPVIGQELQQFSEEEIQAFLEQYQFAFQKGSTQKITQLISYNRKLANTVAEYLLKQGMNAYWMTNYETALTMLILSQKLNLQLENKKGNADALLSLGIIYQATGKYQLALESYQESLFLFRTIENLSGEGAALHNIGGVYLAVSEYQKALTFYQESLTIRRAISDRAGEGAILHDIGEIYRMIGAYPQALSFYKKALIIFNELGDLMNKGRILNILGIIYQTKGEWKKALASYQEALGVFEAIGSYTNVKDSLNDFSGVYGLPENYTQTLVSYQEAITRNEIGMIYEMTGAYPQALTYYQAALIIFKAIENHEGEMLTFNNIGMICLDTGDYPQALTSLQEALTLARKIGDRMGEARALNGLGMVYKVTGDYPQALTSLQEALTLARKIGTRIIEGDCLNNFGVTHSSIGEYQLALNYLQDALTIYRAIGDRTGEGTSLCNMGTIYKEIGDYQKALNFLLPPLSLFKEIGHRKGEARTLNAIGLIYIAIGEYRRALNYLQEALTICKEIEDLSGQGEILHNIGSIYQTMREYQQALASYQASLKIFKTIGNRAGEGTVLNNIAGIYYAIGDHQHGMTLYWEALTLHRSLGNRSGEVSTLNNIGTGYVNTGEYPRALYYLQEALSIAKICNEREGEVMALDNVGFIYEQQKRWKEAVESYQQAIALLEVIRNKAGGSETKESFLEKVISIYPRTVGLFLQLNDFKNAFAYTEREKARSFLERLYEASTGVKHGEEQQLVAEETNLYGKLAVIEQNLKEQINNEQRNQLLQERHTLEHELSVLQMKLRTSNPRYAELKYPQPVTVEQVQQEILKEGEVLVEYLQGNEELYVFIIGKRNFVTHTIEINTQDLSESMEQFLEPLRSPSHEKLNEKLANQLYQLVFQPLEHKITEANQGKEAENLIIVPDAFLFYLPFEILVTKDGETPEYLVDRYTISYSPSASVLKPDILPARQPEQYAQDLLALAPFGEGQAETTQVAMRATENLLLSDTLRSGLEGTKPLPYSVGEVQTISNLYPQSVCKIGTDATKAFFTDHAKGNRYLHLSTHGYLDNEHAMYSGLLFSDGMLQTYEIFNLDIDAELTVLSACQTGLGELKAGEGLVGLTRAFMYAGSPSVLVSLWPVSDPSTAAFMKRFYRNLNRGMTKAEALRKTKIWMKAKSYHTDEHGNVIKHDDPFYWAPFILVGDWE